MIGWQILHGFGRSLGVAALYSACFAAVGSQQQPAPQTESWIVYRARAATPNPNSQLGRDSIFVIAAEGGEPVEVLNGIHGGYGPFQIQWVPGRPEPVASVDVPQGERFGLGVFPRIWVVDWRKSDSQAAAFGTSTAEFAVSPDGQRVAYVTFSGAGGSELEVAPLREDGEVLTTDSSWKVWEPCWSPDGRFVVHRAGLRKNGGADNDSWGMYRLDVRSGRREKFAPMYSFPQYLPGGDSLLVMEYTWPEGPKALLLLDIASGETTELARGLAPLRPALSPDGARIACVLADEDRLRESNRIAVVGLHGKAPRQVARGRAPSWSPAGKRLAYEREGFIWVLDLESGAEKKLVEGTAPAWSR